MGGMTPRLRPDLTRSSRTRRAATLAASALLTAGLAACGGAEVEEPTATTPAVEEAEQSADEAADDAAGQGQDETAEASDGAAAEGDAADDAGADDAAAGLAVTSEGRGAMILRYTGEAGGEAETVEGKLITGPGGCLSLQPGGQPKLMLFPEGTEFAENPPRVTIDGTEVKVGGQVSVTASSVALADLDGVPEQCAAGAAPTVWVVSAS